MVIKQTEQAIANIENWAFNNLDMGITIHPSASYERGVVDALAFLRGEDSDLDVIAEDPDGGQ